MKVTAFKASNFEGSCNVDEEFIPLLKQMNTIAIKHSVVVVITSSLRMDTNVKGAIVLPAQMSNHLVGHAIDCNIRSRKTGEYFNSKKMGDNKGVDDIFLQDVDANTALSWGASFNIPDSIHLDDRLNIKYPEKWHEKYKSLHQ